MAFRFFVLFFSVIFSISKPVIGFSKCSEVVTGLLERAAEPSRVWPAVVAVLEDYHREGRDLKFLGGTDEAETAVRAAIDEFGMKTWPEMMLSSGRIQTIELKGPTKYIGGFKGGEKSVQRILLESGEEIFRPILTKEQEELYFMSYEKVRRTFAATALNNLMGLTIVPDSRFVRTPDNWGVASAIAKGTTMQKTSKLKDLDADSVSEVMAFEFLVGNQDTLIENFFVDSDRKLISVDHDLGFVSRVAPFPKSESVERLVGSTLPDRYTARFIKALQESTPDRIRSALSPHLTSYEVESVLFRRDILLKDISRRGPF